MSIFKFTRVSDPEFDETKFTEKLAEKLSPMLGIGKIEGIDGATIFIRKKTDQPIKLKDYLYPKNLNLEYSDMSEIEQNRLTNLIKLVI